MKKKRKNYNPMYEVEIGQKFGMLTALNSTSHREDIITLKCECGKIKSMEALWLFKGKITNCGCVLTTRPKYYEWFEEQMDKWDPTCHRTDMKRLPYFKATKKNNPHMTIDGWTYVDNYTYEFAKNIVWTRNI